MSMDRVTAADVIAFIEAVCFIPEGKHVGEKLALLDFAPTDADLLSILIDDARAGHDLQTTVSLYTAVPELDPFALETIRLANPALGTFLNEKEVLSMAEAARRMPAREAEYRNLILNQRVEVSCPFIAPGVWAACGSEVGSLDGVPVFGGLDLSSTSDLTALVLIGWKDGKWRVRPTFWLPAEGLAEKAVADRTPWDLWARQGFLQTTPGRTVSYEYVAQYLRGLFDRYDIQKIGFDRMVEGRPRGPRWYVHFTTDIRVMDQPSRTLLRAID